MRRDVKDFALGLGLGFAAVYAAIRFFRWLRHDRAPRWPRR